MYKVLVVDDELLVRVGLKTTIDWQSLGFDIVGEAADGEQGFAQYRKYRPDVVFADIKMPGKDGFWLVDKIREEDKHVRIIMLTCMDDFAYARNALKKGADDYILKSEIEPDELVGIIKSVKEKLDAKTDSHNVTEMGRDVVGREILDNLMDGEFEWSGDIQKQLDDILFCVEDSKLSFASVEISHSSVAQIGNKDVLKNISTATINIILDKLITLNIDYLYTSSRSGGFFWLSSKTLSTSRLKEVFDSVSTAAKQYFDIQLSILFCRPFTGAAALKEKYEEILSRQNISFYENNEKSYIIISDAVSFSTLDTISFGDQYNARLISYISDGKGQAIEDLLKEITDDFHNRLINPEYAKVAFCNMVVEVFKTYDDVFAKTNQKYITYYNSIQSAQHISEVVGIIDTMIGVIDETITNERMDGAERIIQKAKAFICENFSQNISLENVAEALSLSKHYLSSLFAKGTGMHMTYYINQVRVDEAKKLLRTTNLKVKEIYDRVGFTNQQYFSKVFKKTTGKTVMGYRDEVK